jgi:hypothetical protein
MKFSTENDNNFGYEKITILGDNMPLSYTISKNFSTVKMDLSLSDRI